MKRPQFNIIGTSTAADAAGNKRRCIASSMDVLLQAAASASTADIATSTTTSAGSAGERRSDENELHHKTKELMTNDVPCSSGNDENVGSSCISDTDDHEHEKDCDDSSSQSTMASTTAVANDGATTSAVAAQAVVTPKIITATKSKHGAWYKYGGQPLPLPPRLPNPSEAIRLATSSATAASNKARNGKAAPV